MTQVTLDGLVKIYPTKVPGVNTPVINGINLSVQTAEMLVVQGPSGSGKTTLLRMIYGIEKPSAGTISIEGIGLINSLSEQDLTHYRKSKVGFVQQDSIKNLVQSWSVLENIELKLLLRGFKLDKKINQEIIEVLEVLDLVDLKNIRVNKLSGGEIQRTAIASVLVDPPPLILADEPTSELDSRTTKAIGDYLSYFNKKNRITFIVVTHDPLLVSYGTNVLTIKDGMI